ncbi:MAG: Na+:solute symporter, partial [Bacteroidetes bacterium]|nr:Na+:solute symporter [Bacteroidota bacterium]
MTNIDYIVIIIFSLLILSIGLSFSKTSGKDMRSFFSAGGAVPWWINGLSLFMGFISAGTFVVWGSIAYNSGWVAITIQWTMSAAGFLMGLLLAPKWHKTRALTAAEYISNRLGVNVQKSYSYIYLVVMIILTGVHIYAVSRILEVITGIPLYLSITILGTIVMLYTSLGGLWAVVVTDTLQFVILSAAALIVVPLSLNRVGGIQHMIASIPDKGFFNLSNGEYTWSFLIGFMLYNFFYLSGQWSFVQRYTSVKTPQESRKVGWLFGTLYIISPIIWMLPPMAYHAINPHLSGLQNEGAYLLMCKEVLPSGMLGLMLISLVFATNSSVQGVLNISAGVITNDLYKNKFPQSSEKKLMVVAKLSTLLFGIITIALALFVPIMGGAKEVVLSVAALTGCPIYLPIIWSLFSKRQSGFSVLITSLVSLAITLSFKFIIPLFSGFVLSRQGEITLGVGVPAFITLLFEIWLRIKDNTDEGFVKYKSIAAERILTESKDTGIEASSENNQGLRMIAIGITATGLIIITLGIMANNG